MALPDNLPPWAKIGIQWVIIGVVAGVAYDRLTTSLDRFEALGTSMTTQLASINDRISHLDVTDDRLNRLAADMKAASDKIERLQEWQRVVITRERWPQ